MSVGKETGVLFGILLGGLLAFGVLAAPQGDAVTGPTTRPVWDTPKSSLPLPFIYAVRTLFLDCPAPMADPTGGEYRQVTIKVTGPYNGDLQSVTTHAWVVDRAAIVPRAVCWNGLAYPVQKLGDKADLDADINSLIDKERAAMERYKKDRGNLDNYIPSTSGLEQKQHVAWNTLDDQHVAMLLRAGRPDLADKMWNVLIAPIKEADRGAYADSSGEPLILFYAMDLANRALGEFARHTDSLAAADARACLAVCAFGRKSAAARDRKNPQPEGANPPDDFASLDALKLLVADLGRRAKEGPYDPVLLKPEKYPDKKVRIAALIRDLELVGNYPAGSTDDLQIMPEVMIKLLQAEGDDIVEPLLECYQHDTRLTRRFDEPRQSLFSEPEPLQPVSVREMALEAVQRIVGVWLWDFPVAGDSNNMSAEEFQAARLDAFRALWSKLRKLAPEERQYAILADDDLTPDFWRNAADSITGRNTDTRDDPQWNKVRDHLRNLPKAKTSVRDLLVRRGLIECLFAWDGRAALDATRGYKPSPNLAPWFYEQRARLGDPRALEDYAAWLKSFVVEYRDGGLASAPQICSPLWTHPDNPALQAAAQWAFQGADSPWNPILPMKPTGPGAFPYHTPDCLNSPLLGLEPFRRQVLALLDNTEEVGTVGVQDNQYRTVRVKQGWFDPNRGNFTPADLKPLIGHPMPIRACDTVATLVSLVPGALRFELHWDKPRRDKALAALKDFLTRYGHNIGENSHNLPPFGCPAVLHFPKLAAPATPQQVAAGDAIFSLAAPLGQGTAQIVNMPLPRRARWFTNTDLFTDDDATDPATGEKTTERIYLNEGSIWQAEDLTANGKTTRYFGLIWQGGMQRVPADQIDLIPDWRPGPQWTEFPGGVDLKVTPAGRPAETLPPEFHLAAGDRITITFRLRNRRAVPQPIDSHLADQDRATGALRLREGFTLHVVKLRPGAAVDYIFDPAKTIPLTPRLPITSFAPAPLAPPDPARTLRQPEEEFDAADIDLGRIFDLGQAGTYGVWVNFRETAGAQSMATQPVALVLHPAALP